MRRIIMTTMLSAALVGGAVAQADDLGTSGNSEYNSQTSVQRDGSGVKVDRTYQSDSDINQQPGTISDMSGDTSTSTTRASDVVGGYLTHEKFGIRPQVGTLLFKDFADNTIARAVGGLTIDANIMGWFNNNLSRVYLGPETGVLYSHIGSSGSSFFGTGSGSNASLGSGSPGYFLEIPIDAKLGYNFTDNLRLAAHGGGNYLYRSIASSLPIGGTTAGNNSSWDLFPNVGADLEFGLGQHAALTLRPDVTFTSGNDIFTGTVALAIPIG